MTRSLNVRAFCSQLAGGSLSSEPTRVVVDSPAEAVYVKLLTKPASEVMRAPLVIVFHGIVDPRTRSLPVFEGQFLLGRLARKATVLSIADSALDANSTLPGTWYVGSQEHDMAATLRTLITEIIRALEPSRIIFVGGSMGGHPALAQSHHVPDSVAVVVNPIVMISSYNSPTVAAYRSICWPDLRPDRPLSDVVLDDVGTLYAAGHLNSVIYLQNATDGHLHVQAAPFLAQVKKMRVLFLSEFLADHLGHAYSTKKWARWVKAAVDAPSVAPIDIARTEAEIVYGEDRSSRKLARTATPQDYEIARKIYQQAAAAEG